jgi:hypothetical protein
MAKSRRKNGGVRRGRFKLKKLGKGWLALRSERGKAMPKVRTSNYKEE